MCTQGYSYAHYFKGGGGPGHMRLQSLPLLHAWLIDWNARYIYEEGADGETYLVLGGGLNEGLRCLHVRLQLAVVTSHGVEQPRNLLRQTADSAAHDAHGVRDLRGQWPHLTRARSRAR